MISWGTAADLESLYPSTFVRVSLKIPTICSLPCALRSLFKSYNGRLLLIFFFVQYTTYSFSMVWPQWTQNSHSTCQREEFAPHTLGSSRAHRSPRSGRGVTPGTGLRPRTPTWPPRRSLAAQPLVSPAACCGTALSSRAMLAVVLGKDWKRFGDDNPWCHRRPWSWGRSGGPGGGTPLTML